MEDKKYNITLAPGQNEVIIREGEAPDLLPVKEPIPLDVEGVLSCPVEYLAKRIELLDQMDCHVIVNREKVTIQLIVKETDAYKRASIIGKLQFHPKFLEFGINQAKVWSPTELGLFIKMNRSFFADRTVSMSLVTKLMNFTAEVSQKIERDVQENGNRKDNFVQMVNSSLPASFMLQIPIFKGYSAESLEVETFANVNGREVSFLLLSPGAQGTLEEIRDKAIDEQIEKIKELAPDIAIFEV